MNFVVQRTTCPTPYRIWLILSLVSCICLLSAWSVQADAPPTTVTVENAPRFINPAPQKVTSNTLSATQSTYCTQLIINGNFENADLMTEWAYSAISQTVTRTTVPHYFAPNESFSMLLPATNIAGLPRTPWLKQTISIPAWVTTDAMQANFSATLTAHIAVNPEAESEPDPLYLVFRTEESNPFDPISITGLITVATGADTPVMNPANPSPTNDEWLLRTVDLTDYINLADYTGQNIDLYFESDNPDNYSTRFYLDNVQLTLCTDLNPFPLQMSPSQTATLFPGQNITFSHTITNNQVGTGNIPEPFSVTVTSNMNAQVIPEQLSLLVGESATVNIVVQVPTQAISGTIYEVGLDVISQTQPETTAHVVDTIDVLQQRGVWLTSGQTRSANVDEPVVYTHTLSNLSNISETLTLTYVSDPGAIVTVTSPDNLTLPPFGETTITATVQLSPQVTTHHLTITTGLLNSGTTALPYTYCEEAIQNGNFEDDNLMNYWVYNSIKQQVLRTTIPHYFAPGQFFSMVLPATTIAGLPRQPFLYQPFTLPTWLSSLTTAQTAQINLQLHKAVNPEVNAESDPLYVILRDQTGTITLTNKITIATGADQPTINPTDPDPQNSEWVLVTSDLWAAMQAYGLNPQDYVGQDLQLYIYSPNPNGDYSTSFYLDNISLNICLEQANLPLQTSVTDITNLRMLSQHTLYLPLVLR